MKAPLPKRISPAIAANSANVVASIARLRSTLDELERAVAERDTSALRALLERAADARRRLG